MGSFIIQWHILCSIRFCARSWGHRKMNRAGMALNSMSGDAGLYVVGNKESFKGSEAREGGVVEFNFEKDILSFFN